MMEEDWSQTVRVEKSDSVPPLSVSLGLFMCQVVVLKTALMMRLVLFIEHLWSSCYTHNTANNFPSYCDPFYRWGNRLA